MDKVMYLVRGLPGSGKSTLAAKLSDHQVEADDFFWDSNEDRYIFDPTALAEAHDYCQAWAKTYCQQGVDTIAVANTFTRHWEMAPYREMAKEYGYQVVVITCKPDTLWPNVHSVPEATINRMRARWED